MANTSLFPSSVEFEGDIWHLLYDPANDTTVQPNLSGARVIKTACDPVRVAGAPEGKTLYMVVVDLLIPASAEVGRVTTEKRLKAFRVYDYMPPNLDAVQPREMVYYIAEPRLASKGNASQAFLDTVLGVALAENRKKNAVDTGWGKNPAKPYRKENPAKASRNRRRCRPWPRPSRQETSCFRA